jgi:hypothetical protein
VVRLARLFAGLAGGKPDRRGNAAFLAQNLENPVSMGFALTTIDCGAKSY